MISKSCEYGIKAVLHIAHMSQQGKRVGLKAIAKEIESPEAFTAKIMQQLARNKIVSSTKGPNGGFEMNEHTRENTNIKDIVEVIDGGELYTKCAIGLSHCNDSNPCPVHNYYTEIREQLMHLHTKASIDELAQKLDDSAQLK